MPLLLEAVALLPQAWRDTVRAMSEENVEIVRRMVEAFNRGDVDAVIATFGEQCALHEPPEAVGTPRAGFRGHDGIREWMANLGETAEIQFEPTGFITNGDSVLCEWVGRGVGRAGGVPIEWSTFVALRLRDGKIEQALAFLSRAEASKPPGFRSNCAVTPRPRSPAERVPPVYL